MSEPKALNVLPYEATAMAGGEMPKGMEYPDQILFTQLRLLYDTLKRGIIDREAATKEKIELLREYEAHKIVESMGKRWVEQIKVSDIARADYKKNRTIENADKLVACIEGRRYG